MSDISSIGHGLVTARFLSASLDVDTDLDDLPEELRIGGSVTFTPTITQAAVGAGLGGDPFTLLPVQIIATVDPATGILTGPDGTPGVRLIASDSPLVNPSDWQYTAKFSLTVPDGTVVNRSSFAFRLPGGTTVDLSEVAPVAVTAGVQITRGERGPQGAGISIIGRLATAAELPDPALTELASGSGYIVDDSGDLHVLTTTAGVNAWVNSGSITGPANVITIGTVQTSPSGGSASATLTGTSPEQVLSLVIPRGTIGATGPTGPAPVVTATALLGLEPAVTVTEVEPGEYELQFTLPRGEPGLQGPQGEMHTSAYLVVEHGAVADTARPTSAGHVLWVGSAEPVNKQHLDQWVAA